jgi:RNA polymerase sigma-70 factor (ECF subfamily)
MPFLFPAAPLSWQAKVYQKIVVLLFAAFGPAATDEAYDQPFHGQQQPAVPPSNEERNLFKAIAAGDEEAFKSFYDLTSSRVYGYCMKMTGGEVAVATELLQETYINLWKARASLADVAYPRAYIVRIASRVVYRHFSAKYNKRRLIALHEADQLVAPEVASQVSLETKEILQLIEIAVRQLPAQQQQVFRLNKYDGLSYKEIAARLGISASAVSNYLELAMKKVRASVLGA